MTQKKTRLIFRLIIAGSISLVVVVAVIWVLIFSMRQQTADHYTIIQNEFFQRASYISKSLSAFYQVKSFQFSNSVEADVRMLEKITRSVAGYYEIGRTINADMLSRLPDDGPLMLRFRINEIEPRLASVKQLNDSLITALQGVEETTELKAIITGMGGEIDNSISVLEEYQDLHPQLQSYLFVLLEDNFVRLLERLNILFYVLFTLFSLTFILAVLFFFERRKYQEALIESHQLLEEKVRERTKELSQSNQHLANEIKDREVLEFELRLKSDALENSLNGFDIVDVDAKFIYVNKAYVEMWGYEDKEEIIGTSPESHCSDPEIPAQLISELREHGRCIKEFVGKRKDGSLFDVLMYARLAHDESGREIYPTTSIDVTDRRRAEKELMASEEKFRAIFEQAGGYCMILDPNTDDGIPLIIDANRAACAAHGYTREEFIGRPVADIDDEDGKRLVKQRTAEIMTGEPFYVENVHLRKDGTSFPVAVNAIRIDVGDDKRPLIVTTEYDISERTRAQEVLNWELQVNKALAVLSNTLIDPDHSITTIAEKVLSCAKEITGSAHGYVSEVDRETLENVGHTLTSMMGDSCRIEGPDKRIAFPCGSGGEDPRLFGHSLNKREPFYTNTPEEYLSLPELPNGHVVFQQFLSVPVIYDKEIVGQIALANNENGYAEKHLQAIESIAELYALAIHRKRDLEDLLEMEHRLRQAQKMEAVGTLAGGIAHEFNNMLAIMIGNNELIMDELPTDSLLQESAEEIRIAGLRARDVVKQLLTFSRQDDVAHKVLDFRTVVADSVRLIRSSTPANITLEQYYGDTVFPVLGNETQVNQLLINLCNNSIDALPDKGGTIRIELINETVTRNREGQTSKIAPGRYVKLMVEDNGSGMEDFVLERMFEPYFSTKEIGKGAGIGMAVVHGIVEKHGGFIEVESRVGKGTKVEMFFPAHAEMSDEKTRKAEMLPTGTERILYVDDELPIAKLGQRHLVKLGYRAEYVTDPEDALEKIRENPDTFDLVISDMAMPKMTGDELIVEVHRIRPGLPTIICTGYSSKMSEERAAEIGISAFTMKPFNKSELAETVRKVLDSQ